MRICFVHPSRDPFYNFQVRAVDSNTIEQKYQSLVNYISVFTNGLSRRYDYILPSTLLFSNMQSSQVFRTDLLAPLPPGLNGDDDAVASDHLPVLAEFTRDILPPRGISTAGAKGDSARGVTGTRGHGVIPWGAHPLAPKISPLLPESELAVRSAGAQHSDSALTFAKQPSGPEDQ